MVKTQTRIGLTVLMAACGPIDEETRLDELRVVSIRGSPPYVDGALGTTLTATTYAPGPIGVQGGVRVLLWTCTLLREACVEEGMTGSYRPLSSWTSVRAPEGGEVSLEVAGPGLGAGDAPLVTTAWALACEDAACPLLDLVDSDPEPGSERWRAAVAALRDPFDLLRTLPMEGTAASFRSMPVLSAEDGSGLVNPTVALMAPWGDSPLHVQPDVELVLEFAVTGAASAVVARPLASAGGFTEATTSVEGEHVSVTWLPGDPDEPDEPSLLVGTVVQLFVVFEAADGGSALWQGEALVGP